MMTAVSCPSLSLCVAADDTGDLIATTHPTGRAAAWSVSSVVGSDPLAAISCPSTSLCVAVDDAGNLVTSTTPWDRRRAWTVTRLDPPYSAPPASYPYALLDVSCPSLSLCVAIDGAGDIFASTHPTGGAATWKLTRLPGGRASPDSADAYGAVSCTSRTLCVTVGNGDAEVPTDPTARAPRWQTGFTDPDGGTTDGSNPMTDVSCPTAALCVAVDSDFNVLTSTTPAFAQAMDILTAVCRGGQRHVRLMPVGIAVRRRRQRR
jgi:hypothetical protein